MARQFIRAVAILALLLPLGAPVWAGFEEGVAAYGRGDYATALREFRPLAEQGDALAQYRLGIMSTKGQGIPQDYVQGHMWFNLAGAQGHVRALKDRNLLAKNMTAAQIAEAQRLAREWTAKKEGK